MHEVIVTGELANMAEMTELKQVKRTLCPALFYVLFPVPVDGAFWILVTYQRGTKEGVVCILSDSYIEDSTYKSEQ